MRVKWYYLTLIHGYLDSHTVQSRQQWSECFDLLRLVVWFLEYGVPENKPDWYPTKISLIPITPGPVPETWLVRGESQPLSMFTYLSHFTGWSISIEEEVISPESFRLYYMTQYFLWTTKDWWLICVNMFSLFYYVSCLLENNYGSILQ